MNVWKIMLILIAVLILMLVEVAGEENPPILNAQRKTVLVKAGLGSEIRAIAAGQAGPLWIGYAVPAVKGKHTFCCFSSAACDRCFLEGEKDGASYRQTSEAVKLESTENLIVLFRVVQREIMQIRVFSMDCRLDAGGLPFYWLSGIRPAESIAFLEVFPAKGVVKDSEEDDAPAKEAVMAIAHHGDSAADQALARLAGVDRPQWLREQAIFWMGVSRGHSGYIFLRDLLQKDPDSKIREKTVFALSLNKDLEAVSVIVDTARKDPSPKVRGQALFWLAQKAGKKAEAAITEAIENDPETEVKKKAVFALSQLPDGEGVTRLLEVVRTNKNPAVRKQALFWLGQSKDPRALDLFEKILMP